MAYNAVAQGERDVLSEGAESIGGPSPEIIDYKLRPLSFDFGKPAQHINHLHIGHDDQTEPRPARLGSMMRSLASNGSDSYHVVEDDNYEDPQINPLKIRKTVSPKRSSVHEQETPTRTISISKRLQLAHPMPDLQSLQGAYVRNVERLEDSAEHLSMTSSLEEELRKMKLEQRRPERQSPREVPRSFSNRSKRQNSTSSKQNSIIGVNNTARSGGYSPSGYITSPRGSILSGSWSQTSANGRPMSKSSRFQAHLPEPGLEGRPLDSIVPSSIPVAHALQSVSPSNDPDQQNEAERLFERAAQEAQEEDINQQSVEARQLLRHASGASRASNDTYRQATSLFADFDGVHATPHAYSRQISLIRQVSLTQPPLAANPVPHDEPEPGESMVYYPAPVPMMLNLPQRLSKLPSASERERRRLKGISEIPAEMRQSAAWLDEDGRVPDRRSARLSHLPAHLRANAFFEKPTPAHEVQLKDASAVATLDSILDAAAHAPVSAFTDHPIVGHLGKEVYGKQHRKKKSKDVTREKDTKKRRSSLSTMLRTNTGLTSATVDKTKRKSSVDALSAMPSSRVASGDHAEATGKATDAVEPDTEAMPRHSQDMERDDFETEQDHLDEEALQDADAGLESDEDEDQESELESDDDDRVYNGPPTTLLAELQMRKAMQKQRNRTAANAFPNGMHSTLLELDAVATLQQKSRKQKHIALAWEDHQEVDRQNFDDDDVPLGLLFIGKPGADKIADRNRPMGLMAKRDMEDNEPLSARRARLRGEPLPGAAARPTRNRSPIKAANHRASTMYTLEIPGVTDNVLDEVEGETLGQRVKRLKLEREAKEKGPPTSNDFADDVSSHLGLKTTIPTVEPEETLGQRRKRLKEEAQMIGSRQVSGSSLPGNTTTRPELKPRRSMADILAAHPTAGNRVASNESRERGLLLQHSQSKQHLNTQSQAQAAGNPLQDARQENQRAPTLQTYQRPNFSQQQQYPSFNGAMNMPGYIASPTIMSPGGYGYNQPNPLLYQPTMGVNAYQAYGINGVSVNMNGISMMPQVAGYDPMGMGPPLDPKQRAMIDQWRQSVVQ